MVPDLEPPYTAAKLAAIKPLKVDLMKHNATRVIVNAYYRSGSTVLGRMLKLHPSVFYLFEPYQLSFLEYKVSRNMSRTEDLFVDPITGNYRWQVC